MAGIGVFGGTFNPPHKGHLKLVRCFADRLSLSKVLIIPTFTPPHKAASQLASCEDRLEMCRLLFSCDSRFEISTIETDRGGKSYTYDTLSELKKIYPDNEIYFIIGSDMLRTFYSWYRPADILKMCRLCAASRDSGEMPEFDGEVITLSIDPVDISSTDIRNAVRSGVSVEKFVGKEVENYIHKRGLYCGQ